MNKRIQTHIHKQKIVETCVVYLDGVSVKNAITLIITQSTQSKDKMNNVNSASSPFIMNFKF